MESKIALVDLHEEDSLESFVIDNPLKAAWAAEKIKNEYEQLELFNQAADLMIDELKAKKTMRQNEAEAKTAGLKQLLNTWLDTVTTKKAKKSESIKLPNVTIRRVFAGQTLVPNKEKLITKFKGTDYVKTKEDFAWGEFKKITDIIDGAVINKETGEVIGNEYIEIVETDVKIEVE